MALGLTVRLTLVLALVLPHGLLVRGQRDDGQVEAEAAVGGGVEENVEDEQVLPHHAQDDRVEPVVLF